MAWFDTLEVQCVEGDIFAIAVDAIVVNVNVTLSLNYTLGRRLAKECGPDFVRRVEDLRDTLPGNQLALGESVTIDARSEQSPEPGHRADLPFRKVILAAWWAADNPYSPTLIYKLYVNALRQAFQHHVCSLAMPLVGTGSQTMSFQDLEKGVTSVLRDLDGLPPSDTFSVEDLYFVSVRPDDVRRLRVYLDSNLLM